MKLVDESTLWFHGVPKLQKQNALKRKLQKRQSLTSKLREVAQVPVEDKAGLSKMTKKEHTLLKESKSHLDSLMSPVKSKFNSPITYYNKKIQLLTLKPKSWTVNKTSEFFNCSQNQVQTSK